MKVIKLLILVTIAASTIQAMQKPVATKITVPIGESKVEQDLVFMSGDVEIARIPESLAKIISPVFKAQLESPIKFGEVKDRYIINIEDTSPDTVGLFANIVLAIFPKPKTPSVSLKSLFVPRPVLLKQIARHSAAQAAQKEFTEKDLMKNLQTNKELILSFLQSNRHLLLDLYDFLGRYQITTLIPLLANPLIQEIAQEEQVYNQKEFILEHGEALQALTQSLCIQQKVFFREPLIISESELNPSQYFDFVVSPGGHYIAIIKDKKVQIYDAHRKTTVGTIEHNKAINKAKFSPDETLMVTTSEDGTAKIYDLHKKEVTDIIKHEGNVNSVDVGKKFIVTASEDSTAKIYDLHKKEVTDIIKDNGLTSALLNPDETLIVTTSIRNEAKIYNIDKKKVVHTFTIDDEYGHAVVAGENYNASAAFSPDGKLTVAIFNTSTSGAAKIWNAQKQEVIYKIKNPNSGISTFIRFSPDNHYIAFVKEGTYTQENTYTEGGIYLYNTQENQAFHLKINDPIFQIYFSSDGNFLVAETSKDSIPVYIKPFKEFMKMEPLKSMAFSPDTRYIIGGMADYNTGVQDYNILTVVDRLSKKEIIIRTNGIPIEIKFSPDNSFFIVQYPNNELLLYPITTCGMPYEQIIAIAALMHMKEDVKLNQSSWLYQTFMQLPEKERTEFIKQYLHVGIIMANIITIEQEQEQKPKAISEDEQQEQDEMMMVDE